MKAAYANHTGRPVLSYPIRWYMGDGSMAHPVAYVDEENIDPTVPDRKYKYCGTGYGDEEEYGLSCLSGANLIKSHLNR